MKTDGTCLTDVHAMADRSRKRQYDKCVLERTQWLEIVTVLWNWKWNSRSCMYNQLV